MFKKINKEKPMEETTKIEEKKLTLPEKIDDLNRKIDIISGVNFDKKKKKKIKEYKVPYKVKSKLKKLTKKEKVVVWILCENGNFYPKVVKVTNGYITINGVPRLCTMDYRYLYLGKYPSIILQEWDLEPIGLKQYYDKNQGGLPLAMAERFILAARESGEVKSKKSMSRGAMVMIGLAIIAGIYVLAGGGA